MRRRRSASGLAATNSALGRGSRSASTTSPASSQARKSRSNGSERSQNFIWIPPRSDSQTFAYIQPDRDGEPVELAPEPSWGRVAYKR